MRILSVDQMRNLEAAANVGGLGHAEMMEAAGQHVAEIVYENCDGKNSTVVVLVGPGNNGGDGLVAARYLAQRGLTVRAWLSQKRDHDQALVKAALTAGVTLSLFDPAKDKEFRSNIEKADVIVDALLGTGAKPPLRGSILVMLQITRASLPPSFSTRITPANPAVGKPGRHLIVSVDGPSGLDFDTGEIDENALPADITVTFAAPKWGHTRSPGCNFTGELVICDIDIPQQLFPQEGPVLATPAMIHNWLPKRTSSGHKGSYGKIMIAAGSSNYTGAAILSGLGAYRAGAGLVTLAIPASLHSAIVPAIPEATYILLPEAFGTLNERAAATLGQHTSNYTSLLIGPGLSNTPETHGFLNAILGTKPAQRKTGFLSSASGSDEAKADLPPLVLDADGLNVISEWPDWWKLLPCGTILTPHPGEMARLTGLAVREIEANRVQIAEKAAKKWGHIVVLKGAYSVIASPDAETTLSPFATSALSTAGSGDVLAGVIATLLGQGCPPQQAAVLGVYIHALAGKLAAEADGEAGVIARDIAANIGKAIDLLK